MQIVSIPPGASFPRQRMNKSGTQSLSAPWNGQTVQITGWVADTTYPGTVVSNQLVIQKAGVGVTIEAMCEMTGSWSLIQMRLNGSAIAQNNSGGAGTKLATATGVTVAVGDTVSLWVQQAGLQSATITAASYVEARLS